MFRYNAGPTLLYHGSGAAPSKIFHEGLKIRSDLGKNPDLAEQQNTCISPFESKDCISLSFCPSSAVNFPLNSREKIYVETYIYMVRDKYAKLSLVNLFDHSLRLNEWSETRDLAWAYEIVSEKNIPPEFIVGCILVVRNWNRESYKILRYIENKHYECKDNSDVVLELLKSKIACAIKDGIDIETNYSVNLNFFSQSRTEFGRGNTEDVDPGMRYEVCRAECFPPDKYVSSQSVSKWSSVRVRQNGALFDSLQETARRYISDALAILRELENKSSVNVRIEINKAITDAVQSILMRPDKPFHSYIEFQRFIIKFYKCTEIIDFLPENVDSLIVNVLKNDTEFQRVIRSIFDLVRIAKFFPNYAERLIKKVLTNVTEYHRLITHLADLILMLKYFPIDANFIDLRLDKEILEQLDNAGWRNFQGIKIAGADFSGADEKYSPAQLIAIRRGGALDSKITTTPHTDTEHVLTSHGF